MNRVKFLILSLATALVSACASIPPADTAAVGDQQAVTARVGMNAPGGPASGGGDVRIAWAESVTYEADGPYPVDLASIPAGVYDPNNQLDSRGAGSRIESQISDEVADLLREEALLMPPQAGLAQYDAQAAAGDTSLTAGVAFDSLDYTDCCGGGGNVPPDSELAVGPNHIIAVVNVAFEIYDKSGTLLSGPTTFSSFFAGTEGCSNTGVFDPNVIYDEAEDRFILGIDGNGTDYCIAATTGSDPLGTWNRYGTVADIGGNFFDYPHAGVGQDAIYMGANMFASQFAEGRVWAIDKFDLYNGDPLTVVTRSTGGDGTPQPMNLHGFNQGTWPMSGPHYILTDGLFNGNTYAVWTWDDPFGANTLTKSGTVNLAAFTGIAAGFPVDVPQPGSTRDIQANDWRVQDAEYRNGDIWMSHTLACNPGGGTVDCIRWARIDPTGPTVIDAGVLSSDDEYRTFPDLAANDCDDMVIGYTKTSEALNIFPSVFVSGRESTDPSGQLQTEVELKAGEKFYTSFESSGPRRWGDYSGMTIDPDGQTFWYLGEYSKNISGTNWGNYIGSFSFPACGGPQPPAKATNPAPANNATNADVESDVSWTAGNGATSHDVYFGTNPTPSDFQGNQAGTSFDPGTLAFSTTYYWRIDEVNTEGTTTGTIWNFTTAPPAPGQAGNPNPSDGATDVDINADLSWSAGSGADSYDVYLNGALQTNTSGTSYDPGMLAENTAYTWRVDSVNVTATTAGITWSFETGAAPPQPAFHIADITVTTVQANGPRTRGRATVTINNEFGDPVSGVEVSGTFGGDWIGVRGDTTDTSGQIVVETPPVKNGNTYTYCVDTASRAGWDFDQTINSFFLCNAPVTTGTIAGVVTDANGGAPIEGASVSADTGQSDTTNAIGAYSLSSVPTGNRTVAVSASGYGADSASTLVSDGATSTVNFALTAVPPGGSVEVRSINVSTVNRGKGEKAGRADVVVEDDQGNLVSGATVSGDFSGTFNESVVSGLTNGSGSTAVETTGTQKGGVSVTFCVTAISHPTLNDFTGEVCSSL